jgi:hydroxymethylglutaryl-CoA lyase
VPGVVYTALVPNVRGAERAIESRTDELNLVMSTSETHNLANLRMTREQSFAGLAQVVPGAGRGRAGECVAVLRVRLPDGGRCGRAEVFGWVQRFADLGVRGITLCDTTGMAYPTQVAAHARGARALAGHGVHAALSQHARHGPGQCAGGH